MTRFGSVENKLDMMACNTFGSNTCCINKADFTELSKSINSMFHWYREATRCYVYLADVPDPNDPGPSDSASMAISAFSNSRRFKRGRTLQELIATKSVQFFSQKCELLGGKTMLVQQIHQITGSPAAG